MTGARYVLRETAIGSVVNGAISAGFYFAIFHGQDAPAVWGARGLVLDCLPQGGMIGLMSVLVPTLLTRRRVIAGKAPFSLRTISAPQNLLAWSIFGGLAGLSLLTGAAAFLGHLTGADTVDFTAGLALKVAFGAVLPWAITPWAIQAAMGPSPGVLLRES